jgi:hypothetical protein
MNQRIYYVRWRDSVGVIKQREFDSMDFPKAQSFYEKKKANGAACEMGAAWKETGLERFMAAKVVWLGHTIPVPFIVTVVVMLIGAAIASRFV